MTVASDRCAARQRNTRAADFGCSLRGDAPHSVHVDPGTGTRWGYPGRKMKGWLPYGLRRDRSRNSGHSTKTHPGVYYSTAPART